MQTNSQQTSVLCNVPRRQKCRPQSHELWHPDAEERVVECDTGARTDCHGQTRDWACCAAGGCRDNAKRSDSKDSTRQANTYVPLARRSWKHAIVKRTVVCPNIVSQLWHFHRGHPLRGSRLVNEEPTMATRQHSDVNMSTIAKTQKND